MSSGRIALPESHDASPNTSLLSPAWNHPRRSHSGARPTPYSRHGNHTALRDRIINNAERLGRRTISTFLKFSLLQKVLAVCGLVTLATVGILFLVFNERIFGWLEPLAARWKNTSGGWIILWALTFLTAFPPLIGYSTCCTTAGFVYGIGEGWLILMTASVAGSFCSFLVSRTILRSYVERLVANDKRFAALTLTLKHDGVKLLCMIRLCPLPYSLSNGAMSTFHTVQPAMYALATFLVSPKLLIHVFIGSRLAAIARRKEKMPLGTKAVNWASIFIGAMIGAFTGLYIYQKTMARAQELEAEEAANARDTTRRTGVPARTFSDDPEAQAASTLAREDDAVDYFDESESASSAPDYQDEYTDNEEEDVFGHGDDDQDDDKPIGLHSKK